MLEQDRQPLRDQPVARRIASHNDNRFGAVLSAFYQFLLERSSATNGIARRDAYSVIAFNDSTEVRSGILLSRHFARDWGLSLRSK